MAVSAGTWKPEIPYDAALLFWRGLGRVRLGVAVRESQ